MGEYCSWNCIITRAWGENSRIKLKLHKMRSLRFNKVFIVLVIDNLPNTGENFIGVSWYATLFIHYMSCHFHLVLCLCTLPTYVKFPLQMSSVCFSMWVLFVTHFKVLFVTHFKGLSPWNDTCCKLHLRVIQLFYNHLITVIVTTGLAWGEGGGE